MVFAVITDQTADRSHFADSDLRAVAKGPYVIRDFAPGKPRHGYVIAQGSSSTVTLVKVLPKLEAAGVNVKVIAAIREELFDRQPQAYRDSVLPPEARYDLMVVSTGMRRFWPLRNLGPLSDECSLTSDFDNAWRTSGLEAEGFAEAHLDSDSIFAGVQRSAMERERRIRGQRKIIGLSSGDLRWVNEPPFTRHGGGRLCRFSLSINRHRCAV